MHLEGTNGMAVHVFVWDCHNYMYTCKIMTQAGIQCMSMDRKYICSTLVCNTKGVIGVPNVPKLHQMPTECMKMFSH